MAAQQQQLQECTLPNGITVYLTTEEVEGYSNEPGKLNELMRSLEAANAHTTESMVNDRPMISNGLPDPTNQARMPNTPSRAVGVEGSSSSTSNDSGNFGKWTNNAVLKLIELFRENEYKFTSIKYKKKDVWSCITESLKNEGFVSETCTWLQVEQKWKNLTKKYRDVTDHNNTSGNDRKTCPFFEQLTEVYGYKPKVNPVCVASSSSGLHSRTTEEKAKNGDDDDSDNAEAIEVRPSKKQRTVKNNSTTGEIMKLLSDINDQQNKRQDKMMEMLKKMHDDKMEILLALAKK